VILRIPHCLDSRLIDGLKAKNIFLLLLLISVGGLVNPGETEKKAAQSNKSAVEKASP
jgi:hypothetical protein